MLVLLSVFAAQLVAAACPVTPDEPFPGWRAQQPEQSLDWYQLYIDCLPPLKRSRAERWPLIFWTGVGEQPLQARQIRALLERGVVQHLPLNKNAIPAARALQAAGAPVIIMQGAGPEWPYSLLPDDSWKLKPADPQRLTGPSRIQADPTRLDAWVLGAQQIRETLQAFRDAGVSVDAVWLDFEPQPLLLDLQTVREALSRAGNIQGEIPQAALADQAAFSLYKRRLYLQLAGAYIAQPIREVFPRALSTNWIVALSSPQVPVLSWDNWHHPLVLTGFGATNPIAYGIDTALLALAKTHPPQNQAEVDRLFLHVMLRQVSADAWNRQQLAPGQRAVPWVSRRVTDESLETPAMSRPAYREALRHLWLRDVSAMQVFNPVAGGSQWRRALAEAQDAQQVYAEMLAAGELLNNGQVMNYQLLMPGEQGVLWSGLRNDELAFVRVLRVGEGPQLLRLQVWPGQSVTLPLGEQGASYLLYREPGQVRVEVLPPG